MNIEISNEQIEQMIMQIVIDIPKGFYNHVKGHKDIFTYGLVNGEKIGEIIANGIVLPEQHGDLIDRDAFERRCMFDADIEDMQDVIYALRDYPTILEARKVRE